MTRSPMNKWGSTSKPEPSTLTKWFVDLAIRYCPMSDDQFDHHHERESRRRDVQVVVEVYRRLSADIERRFATVNSHLRRMERNLQHQMENIMSNQERLDSAVATLGTQFQQVADEVQALKDQIAEGTTPEALDFTGLDAAVQAVSDAVPDDDPAPDHDPDPDGPGDDDPAPEPVPEPGE